MISAEVQDYMYTQIPISKALAIKVVDASINRVILSAPLSPNINHKKTVFGGSLNSIATLACWSLVFINLQQYTEPTEIVISKGEIRYLLPVKSDFSVECIAPKQHEWDKFKNMLTRVGIARIRLNAKIYQANQLAVDYYGEFVAIVKQ